MLLLHPKVINGKSELNTAFMITTLQQLCINRKPELNIAFRQTRACFINTQRKVDQTINLLYELLLIDSNENREHWIFMQKILLQF